MKIRDKVTKEIVTLLTSITVILLMDTVSLASGNLVLKSWAYDRGSSYRQTGHQGLIVDGDNSTCYISTVYTDPWFRIEIGNKDGRTHGVLYVISSVYILGCQGQTCTVNTPDIYVSKSDDVTKVTESEKCGNYDSRSSVTVTCTKPLLGSNIFFRVKGSTSIGVCKVMAYGYLYKACSNGYYGSACNIPCRCQSQCDSVSGVCTVSCDAGWTKDNSGVCKIQICTSGNYGPGCTTPCNCQSQCDYESGVCSTSCVSGKMKDGSGVCSITCNNGHYGVDCLTPCHCQSQCGHMTGECISSCEAGWKKDSTGVCKIKICTNRNYGPGCTTPCNCQSQCDSVSGVCSTSCIAGKMKDSGVCSTTCNNGHYGVDCLTPCHCQSQCDHVTGNCSSCEAGWRKDSTGVCKIKDCSNGNYGPGCTTPCNCQSQCDSVSGVCSTSCVAGKMKDNSSVCNITCNNGHYGVNCSTPCNCQSQCGHVTGECNSSCEAGWKMDGQGVCTFCSNGNYGPGCTTPCNCQSQCHSESGVCSTSCVAGKKKDTSGVCSISMISPTKEPGKQTQYQMANTTLIAIIVIVFVVAIVIVIFVVVIVIRTRRKQKTAVLREKRISRAYEMDEEVMNSGYDEDGEVFLEPSVSARRVNSQPIAVVLPVMAPSVENSENQAAVAQEADVDEEDENVLPPDPIYGNVNDSNVSHSVRVTDLVAYIQTKEEEEEIPFKQEFQRIPSGLMAVCEVGQRPQNKVKNRFVNIWPYDHRRVVLSTVGDDADSDYINACYIDGYKKEKAYIASQAPKICTINDMWRMIWESDCRRITMVTRATEAGRVKCEVYWPESGSCTYGDITVQLAYVKELADYTIRSFNVSKPDCETRSVIHFCFKSWPDHNVPTSTAPILSLRNKIRSFDTSHPGIILIHCSAGVGRTGAFIALDYLLEQGTQEGVVDVYSYVQLMRTQRVNMIQTVAQYHYVYRSLKDAFISGDTSCSSGSFRENYAKLLQKSSQDSNKSGLQVQFEALQSVLPRIDSLNFSFAMERDNQPKNRRDDVLPDNLNRPFLMTPAKGRNNYINAVFANSYRRRDGYIVTQMPLPDTGVDFWRMIYDQNVFTIVMLNTVDETDKNNGRYWPSDRQTKTYEPFRVTMSKTEYPLEDIAVRTIKLINSVKANDDIRTIKHFQLTSWPQSAQVPMDKVSLQLLLEQVDAWCSVTSGPLVVHDMYGLSKCGVFCTISSVRDRIKLDQEVDIFMAVRQVCQGRPQLIENLEQYAFCHEMVERFLSQYDVYENFQPVTNL